jgi:hypothetical protein
MHRSFKRPHVINLGKLSKDSLHHELTNFTGKPERVYQMNCQDWSLMDLLKEQTKENMA